MTPAERRTGAFIYLRELDADEFDRLFESLFMPAQEWQRRLRLTAREMKILAETRSIRTYWSARYKRKCYFGADIKRALIYSRQIEN